MQFPHNLIKKKKDLFLSKEISTHGDGTISQSKVLKQNDRYSRYIELKILQENRIS